MAYLPVDIIVDQKAKERHLIETLNLLAYVILLVFVLMTTWLFKQNRRLCVHETGLAIIYGMILGAALRYIGIKIDIKSRELPSVIPLEIPDDYVIVKAKNLGDKVANITHVYAYEFRGELQPSAKLGSQISYASVDPEVFFNLILPPIVLNAGLSLKRRHFFRNIGAIFSYAFLGTTISVAVTGTLIYGAIHALRIFLDYSYLSDQFSLANCLYFGAIISPTDPLAVLAIFQELGVDVNLFALVFGESILNDAVSIVLTHSIDHFSLVFVANPYYPVWLSIWQSTLGFINMLLSSCIIGILIGIMTALTTKFLKLQESSLLETSLVVLMSYSSFLTAEVLDASGIVAILLCGITQAHYTINNLSFEARERLKNLFELLNFLCENFLFLAVGVSFWQRNQTWNLPFIGIAFVAVILARALSVYPLTGLINLGRRNKINSSFTHVIAWGGAARGVISYSLAARNTVGDARRIMLSTTSVIVIFSVIVVGGSVDWMLRAFNIATGKGDNLEGEEEEYECMDRCSNQPRQQQHHPQHRHYGAAEDSRNLISGNNPNWLVRPRRRLRISNSDASLIQTPTTHHRFCKQAIGHHQLSSSATPILEVDAIWPQRSACSYHQNQANLPGTSDNQQTECRFDLSSHSQQPQQTPVEAPQSSTNPQDTVDLACTCPPSNQALGVTPNERQAISVQTTDRQQQVQSQIQLHQQQQAINNMERPYENASLVRRWRNLDNNYIKPLLTNSHPTLMETLPPYMQRIARMFTSDEQLMRQEHSKG